MNDRDLILGRLGGSSRPESRLGAAPVEPEPGDWGQFALRLGELGGQLLDADSLASHASKRAWIDPDCLSLVESFGHSFAPADSPWEAEVGFTFADFAVAETGSVVIAAGAGRHRLASLASEIHVALIPATSIVATLEEAIARIGPRTSVIITGPSRTADIEGVLVRGIHGPRELVVVRY